MNRQEMFEKSARGILAQGCRAVSSSGICVYRSPNGLKCAVGHLISDEEWAARPPDVIPTLAVADVPSSFMRKIGIPIDEDGTLQFLKNLQRIHDACEPRDWRTELRSFALKYDLDASFIGKERW